MYFISSAMRIMQKYRWHLAGWNNCFVCLFVFSWWRHRCQENIPQHFFISYFFVTEVIFPLDATTTSLKIKHPIPPVWLAGPTLTSLTCVLLPSRWLNHMSLCLLCVLPVCSVSLILTLTWLDVLAQLVTKVRIFSTTKTFFFSLIIYC